MSQREISELDERRNELLDKERLTDKQAAILAAFDDDPRASYADIADVATDLLPEGDSVTGSYAGEQIKQRRPQWFDEHGDRKRPSEVEGRTVPPEEENDDVPDEVAQLAGEDQQEQVEPDDDRIRQVAEEYGVNENRARVMVMAEEQAGLDLEQEPEPEPEPTVEGIAVGLEENDWLRLVSFLHLFADTRAGEKHEEVLMDLAGEITSQALDG